MAIVTLCGACSLSPPDPAIDPSPPIDPGFGTFQPLGPSAAYPWHVVYAPDDPSRIFLGLDDGGGVWRSDDAGASFSLASDELPDALAWAFAIDPVDPARVYAGDGHGRGVFLSRDGGTTWAYSNTGLDTFEQHEVLALAVDPGSSDTLWAGTAGGLHVSHDAGESWQSVDGALGQTSIVAIAAARAGGVTELLVATGQQDETDPEAPGRVHRSVDGGVTFEDLTDAIIEAGAPASADGIDALISDVELDSRGRALVAIGVGDAAAGTVFRSAADGDGFVRLPIEVLGLFVRVSQPASQPDVLFVTGGIELDPAVLVSTDDGKSFEGRGNLADEATLPMSISLDPGDPEHVWLGTYSELLESRDGGRTWSNRTAGIGQSCATGLSAVAVGDDTVLHVGLLAHSGLLGRRNAFRREGETWTELPLPSDVFSIVSPAEDRVVAGTLFHGAYVSRDGGHSFDAASGIPRDEFSVLSLHVTADGAVLASGGGPSGGGIYRSIDGGGRFAPVSVDAPAVANDFVERAGVIVAVGEGGVARSTDGGETWETRYRSDDDLRSAAILDDGGDTLLVGDAEGHVLRSDDGGRTFAPAFTGFDGRAELNRLLLDPRDGSILAGLGSANVFVRSVDKLSGLWRSRDRGDTFERVARALPSSHIYELAWDPVRAGRLYAAMWCSGVQVIDLAEAP